MEYFEMDDQALFLLYDGSCDDHCDKPPYPPGSAIANKMEVSLLLLSAHYAP